MSQTFLQENKVQNIAEPAEQPNDNIGRSRRSIIQYFPEENTKLLENSETNKFEEKSENKSRQSKKLKQEEPAE